MTEETLEFRLSALDKHSQIIAAMLNESWGKQIHASSQMIKKRFKTGQLFVVVYDLPTISDRQHLFEDWSIHVDFLHKQKEKIPVAILETIAIKTKGDYNCVPKTYDELTDFGKWKPLNGDEDTLVMVDATVLSTRRGRQGNQEGKKMIEFAKTQLANSGYSHVWSYTPNIPAVKKWHQKFGAEDTEYVIFGARSKLDCPDVNLMNYSRFAK